MASTIMRNAVSRIATCDPAAIQVRTPVAAELIREENQVLLPTGLPSCKQAVTTGVSSYFGRARRV